MIFCFIEILIYVYFKEAFIKIFVKKAIAFNKNFQNFCQDVVYIYICILQNIAMLNPVILKLWHFEYEAKLEEKVSYI